MAQDDNGPGGQRQEHPGWARVTIQCRDAGSTLSASPSERDLTAANDQVRGVMQAHFPEGPAVAAQAHWEYARWLDATVRAHMRGPAQTDLAVRWDTFGRAACHGLQQQADGRTGRMTFDLVDSVDFGGQRREQDGKGRADPFRGIAPHEIYGALRDATRELGRIAARGIAEVEVTSALNRCQVLVDRMDRATALPPQKERGGWTKGEGQRDRGRER